MSRFGIVLLIRHPRIDPKLITSEMGLTPHRSWRAGEPRRTPRGTTLKGVERYTSWNNVLDVRGPFDKELEKRAKHLHAHRDFIQKIVKEGGEVQLFVQLPGNLNQGGLIKPSTLALIADIGIHFGLEVFPHMPARVTAKRPANRRKTKD